MSDKWASSCRGKRRYNTEKKANAAAKASQIAYGVPMNAYECGFCKKWHVGNTYVANGKAARREWAESQQDFPLDADSQLGV